MNKTNEFSFFLKPSLERGIGIFAHHDISKGTILNISPKNYKPKKFSHEEVNDSNAKHIQNFCIFKKEYILCPHDFNKPELMWYINHSFTPNAQFTKGTWYALTDISKDDEIVCDYNHFGEPEEVKEDYYKKLT